MSDTLETCKNCEQKFAGHFKFCPHCGQQAKDELTVGVLFYNTISNYFSFDARFFKSFFPLLFKPGYLASKFIEGKRLLYLHPAQMYLFITVVFFFLFSFVQRQQVQAVDKSFAKAFKPNRVNVDSILKNQSVDLQYLPKSYSKQIDSLTSAKNSKNTNASDFGFSSKKLDSLIAIDAPKDEMYKAIGMPDDAGVFTKRIYAQGLKFYKSRKGGNILQAFYDTIPIALFFLLPIFALILKLLYRKGIFYAHHLVFSFYYFSFLFLVFSIILAINFIFDLPDWIDFLIMLSTFVYLILALSKFYAQGKLKSFLKASIISVLFLLIVAPITAFILGVYAFMFF
ncbi:DUF3667 domain-containing protein [Hyunsoonleella sp. SJ7]|uniref:DUF3667 domain-containing protein n=1 Tax=Hyunsoonleella aquatilis TaxID=2762758 RepID=A0A923KKZ8_9FLAO|nr:DUF3667 domain-containing protein [Hyunsoonleella aquatilis]MBC3759007.1 DUF3667 domain-containing protein [Hyunsoonleella aquatilis]